MDKHAAEPATPLGAAPADGSAGLGTGGAIKAPPDPSRPSMSPRGGGGGMRMLKPWQQRGRSLGSQQPAAPAYSIDTSQLSGATTEDVMAKAQEANASAPTNAPGFAGSWTPLPAKQARSANLWSLEGHYGAGGGPDRGNEATKLAYWRSNPIPGLLRRSPSHGGFSGDAELTLIKRGMLAFPITAFGTGYGALTGQGADRGPASVRGSLHGGLAGLGMLGGGIGGGLLADLIARRYGAKPGQWGHLSAVSAGAGIGGGAGGLLGRLLAERTVGPINSPAFYRWKKRQEASEAAKEEIQFEIQAKMGTAMTARDLVTKFAAQDNSADQRSATGESRGLSFADSGDSGGYDQGLKAWQSSSKFLHHGKKSLMDKGDPNPFIGKHAASLVDMAEVVPGEDDNAPVAPQNPLSSSFGGETDSLPAGPIMGSATKLALSFLHARVEKSAAGYVSPNTYDEVATADGTGGGDGTIYEDEEGEQSEGIKHGASPASKVNDFAKVPLMEDWEPPTLPQLNDAAEGKMKPPSQFMRTPGNAGGIGYQNEMNKIVNQDLTVPSLAKASVDLGTLESKTDANYRPSVSANKCGNCEFFTSTGTLGVCSKVAGPIDRDFVSDLYVGKAEKRAFGGTGGGGSGLFDNPGSRGDIKPMQGSTSTLDFNARTEDPDYHTDTEAQMWGTGGTGGGERIAADLNPLAEGFLLNCLVSGFGETGIKQAVDAMAHVYDDTVMAQLEPLTKEGMPTELIKTIGGAALKRVLPTIKRISPAIWGGPGKRSPFGRMMPSRPSGMTAAESETLASRFLAPKQAPGAAAVPKPAAAAPRAVGDVSMRGDVAAARTVRPAAEVGMQRGEFAAMPRAAPSAAETAVTRAVPRPAAPAAPGVSQQAAAARAAPAAAGAAAPPARIWGGIGRPKGILPRPGYLGRAAATGGPGGFLPWLTAEEGADVPIWDLRAALATGAGGGMSRNIKSMAQRAAGVGGLGELGEYLGQTVGLDPGNLSRYGVMAGGAAGARPIRGVVDPAMRRLTGMRPLRTLERLATPRLTPPGWAGGARKGVGTVLERSGLEPVRAAGARIRGAGERAATRAKFETPVEALSRRAQTTAAVAAPAVGGGLALQQLAAAGQTELAETERLRKEFESPAGQKKVMDGLYERAKADPEVQGMVVQAKNLLQKGEALAKMGGGIGGFMSKIDSFLTPLFSTVLGKDIAGRMGMWPKLLILGGLLSMLGGGLTGSRGLGGFGGIMMLLGLAPTLFKALTGDKSKGTAEKVIDPGAASTINRPVQPVQATAPAGT